MALTSEILDMRAAARQLLDGVSGLRLGANSLGILFCDSELDRHGELLAELKRKLPFELIGCTTVAALSNTEGCSEMSNGLLVMTADDVRFEVAVSDRINRETVREAVHDAYEQVTAGEEPPAMLLCYPPYNLDIMLDFYPEYLAELSGDIPIFGGYPGHNAPYGINAVFHNEQVYPERMLLVSLRGNVRPLFSVGIELSHVSLEQRTVTRADENAIYQVDDLPFTQYLSRIGIDVERMAKDDTEILFVSNPIMLTLPERPTEDYRIIRTLHRLDLRKGYGVAIGCIPQGHNIAIGSLTRGDISASCERGVAELLEQIAAAEAADPSYRYSTILCSSCVGRFMVMTPRTELEGTVFQDMVPEHLHLAGYYGYGEIGPTLVEDGKALNTAQNVSMTLCAL